MAFRVSCLCLCAAGALAADAKHGLRGRALETEAGGAEHSLGYSSTRCLAGVYKAPAQVTDMRTLWKPFNDTEAHTGVAVYVQFSKVGSESMRCTMWAGVEGLRDTCFAHTGFRYRSGKPMSLKHRHVVQGRYGLCADAKARGMSCSYFTLLRDPVATAVSMYTYFCQKCAEKKRFCLNPNIVSPAGDRCPDMSFLDFTRITGNVYVKEFSGAYACASCADADGEQQVDEGGGLLCRPFEEACGQLNSVNGMGEDAPELLERAKLNLQREVIPVILDELFDANGTHPAGTELLSMAHGWTNLTSHFSVHAHSNEAHYEPSEEELEEARRLLAPDLALYEHAKTVFHQAGAWHRARGFRGDDLTLEDLRLRAEERAVASTQ